MPVSLVTIYLLIPGCSSLKQKRSYLKSILARLHRDFNVSASEMYAQDSRDQAVISCALVSCDAVFNQQVLSKIEPFINEKWPELIITNAHLEVI